MSKDIEKIDEEYLRETKEFPVGQPLDKQVATAIFGDKIGSGIKQPFSTDYWLSLQLIESGEFFDADPHIFIWGAEIDGKSINLWCCAFDDYDIIGLGETIPEAICRAVIKLKEDWNCSEENRICEENLL